MTYRITYTKRFEKNLKKLTATERAQLKKKLEILIMDPLYPSLRTKRIQGTEDLFEFSVNMDVRVIWQYEGDTLILLLDIGHHDILNRF
jgi:mRNA interferase RelE/StbE